MRAHLDLEFFAEADVISYAVEAYTVHGYNECAARREFDH